MHTLFERVIAPFRAARTLFRLMSVIQLESSERHQTRIRVTGSVLIEIDGHAVTIASGHIVRQAAVVHEQPGITRYDAATASDAVAASVIIHRRAVAALGHDSVNAALDDQLSLALEVHNDGALQRP